ncbi:MAG: hypothetical protein K1X89_05165 [Myxococcaceae bacterium]|nr:hypothetical protein [Myxococcaceae bacterium]
MTQRLQRVAAWCWYAGTGFRGYQQQQGERTVQGELLRAFREAGLTHNPVVGGRTDRGVSARMQVLGLWLERDRAPEGLVERLTPHLPADLGFHLARPARDVFHPAFSASSRTYRYFLPASQVGDLGLLTEAAALVPGTRDFRVFHFKTSQVRPRTVFAVEPSPAPGGLSLELRGDAFGRHMVRMLVGALSAVSRREVSLDAFREGLTAQRNFHCPTAAPEPLVLWSVDYAPELDPFSAEERAAFAWPPLTR